MRAELRALCFLLCSLLPGVMSPAHAQAQMIDPSILSQLTPEEKAQLLQGVGNKSSDSTDGQDRVLQNPDVVTPTDRDSGGDDQTGSSRDSGRSRSGNSSLSDRDSASTGTFANPRKRNNGRRDLANGERQQDSSSRDDDLAMPGRLKSTSFKVQPFGYELFSGVPSTFAPATDIPVPGDYVIGPGDNIRVQLFGNQNETFTLLVSRDGTINFPKLGPITINGLSFDQLQSMIEGRVSKEMIGTTASVTLGRLRSMRVFVLGDVSRPGSYTVSSLSTMTHALFMSGGVSTVGSLRRVQLKRAGHVIQTLDLYRFLLGGDSSNDLRLEPGDVVFVPPVGERVTVEGEVKRPAIYELSGERSLADMLALAGGRLASSDQTYVEVERVTAKGERTVLNFDMAKAGDLSASIRDGDVVRVRKIAKQIANEIQVTGYVKYPGSYPWTSNRDLRTVLDLAGVLVSDAQAETYLPLGAIERTNKQTGIREFLSFNVANVLAGTDAAVPLDANDLVIVFGRQDIAFLSSYDVEAVLGGKPSPQSGRCEGLTELRDIVNSQRAVRFLRTLSSENKRLEDLKRPSMRCPDIFREVPRALPFLLDKSVGFYGEVVRPGVYPVAEGTSLKLLLQSVAGVTSESDPHKVEYLSYNDSLHGDSHYQTLDLSLPATVQQVVVAGDIFNFRPVYLDQEIGSIRLLGEVRFPGTYGIVRGEMLSKVLMRAGGLTRDAYPYGAVFTRDAARRAEAASFKRAAADLQEAVVTSVTSGRTANADVAATTAFLENVIHRLESAEPVGRVVVQADPAVLGARPEQDVALEPGDVLLIPKRPNSVTIAGQVLNPGSQLFVPGLSAKKYVEQAGDTTEAADRKRAFIIFPDGSARPIKLSSWNFETQDVPPGSLIIVPRDAAPLNSLLLSERLLSIFSNLAISAAALVTINHN